MIARSIPRGDVKPLAKTLLGRFGCGFRDDPAMHSGMIPPT
jgi:hypothetical protein